MQFERKSKEQNVDEMVIPLFLGSISKNHTKACLRECFANTMQLLPLSSMPNRYHSHFSMLGDMGGYNV